MTGKRWFVIRYAIMTMAVAAVLLAAAWVFTNTGGSSEEKAMQTLEDAVRRAAVSCYAAEGQYPATVDKLIEEYGVRPDARFFIHYDIFAPNLAPDVTVVRVSTQEEMWGR